MRFQLAKIRVTTLETEESGAVSAYVPGLPVYVAADSLAEATRHPRGPDGLPERAP